MRRTIRFADTVPVTKLVVCFAFCLAAATASIPAGQSSGTITNQSGTVNKTMEQKWIEESGAHWVWLSASDDTANQYLQMVQTFDLPEKGADPKLMISVDTNYAVWLNGKFVNFGQWSDYPDDKTYDVLDLKSFARPGANRLCILAYYQGHNTSQYRKGTPGAIYVVTSDDSYAAASGAQTQMRKAPDYQSGPVALVTGQLGFTFEHHGDKSDNWLSDEYQHDKSWSLPGAQDMKPLASRGVRPRPVSKLTLGERLSMRVVSQGVFRRTDTSSTIAAAMQTDGLFFKHEREFFVKPQTSLPDRQSSGVTIKKEALRSSAGGYIVLDTGREEAGLLDLEMDAPQGTVVDVGYGEHLEDLRVRAHVGGRNFAVRHVCGEGRHTFLHPFLRLAGRYIELHITPPDAATTAPITIYYAGLRPTDYPVELNGSFDCPDSLHKKIWQVSEHTLKLCMHEHYEDCPWREQSLYAMDARNQMLAGYYCYGNYDFAAASLKLLGQGMNEEDGFLELCAPARVGVTIPSFSLAWILSLDDYLLFSGDRAFVKSQLPVAQHILQTCTRESSGSIIVTPKGKRMWNFYEWAPGLDGADPRGSAAPDAHVYEAPLNLFYLLALDATARVARENGEPHEEYESKARALRTAFADTFWDAAAGAFCTRIGDGRPKHFAELTQALALIAGVTPKAQEDALRSKLAKDNNGLVPCTISHCLYKFEALLGDKDQRFGPRVFELIMRDWGFMLAQGATTFWETIDGASAFDNAGSLCHGWSGIPVWFYGAWLVGVKPTAPGFAEYKMEPIQGVVDRADGVIPTPSGSLKASWHLEDGKLIKDVARTEKSTVK